MSISSLNKLVNGALQKANDEIKLLLELANDASPDVDITQIKDQILETKPGFSFAKATGLEEDGILRKWLIDGSAAVPSQELNNDMFKNGYNIAKAESYFSLHDGFNKLLAVLIELTGGMPARGIEIVRIIHTNSLGGLRNLFVQDGYVFTALVSNKTGGRGMAKVIPRFLPHAVGQLVILYIHFQVVPFIRLLTNAILGPSARSNALLVDQPGNSMVTDSDQQDIARAGGDPPGLPIWRPQFSQVASALYEHRPPLNPARCYSPSTGCPGGCPGSCP